MGRIRSIGLHWVGCVLGAGALFLVSVDSAAEQAPQAETAPPSDEAPRGSVFVDPLGFALFGPRVGVELGGGHVSGALYGRWFSPGLLAHSLFLSDGDEFAFSYGVGLRGRYYFGPRLDALHLGVAAEYLHTRVENSKDLVGTSSGYVVPYFEAGYRLTLGRFYGDASAGLGYAARTSATAENLPGGDPRREFSVKNESTFYGTASLDLGVTF
jgi:hypothetical protein